MGGGVSAAFDQACAEGAEVRVDEARCRAILGDEFEEEQFTAAVTKEGTGDGCVSMGVLKKLVRNKEADPAFDQAARDLFKSLGLDEDGNAAQPNQEGGAAQYNSLDCIWRHPTTKAAVFVGNMQAAKEREILDADGIRAVVCCIDNENTPFFHVADPEFTYLRFAPHNWIGMDENYNYLPEPSDAELVEFFKPLFDFLDSAVAEEKPVLIHCLAGAHRAGTVGVASLMHLSAIDRATALRVAQTARPAIDPMGHPTLARVLRRLEGAMGFRKEGSATASAAIVPSWNSSSNNGSTALNMNEEANQNPAPVAVPSS